MKLNSIDLTATFKFIQEKIDYKSNLATSSQVKQLDFENTNWFSIHTWKYMKIFQKTVFKSSTINSTSFKIFCSKQVCNTFIASVRIMLKFRARNKMAGVGLGRAGLSRFSSTWSKISFFCSMSHGWSFKSFRRGIVSCIRLWKESLYCKLAPRRLQLAYRRMCITKFSI